MWREKKLIIGFKIVQMKNRTFVLFFIPVLYTFKIFFDIMIQLDVNNIIWS